MARFRLSAPDQEFNSRVEGLFSCLDKVEAQLPEDGLVFESSTSGVRRNSQKVFGETCTTGDTEAVIGGNGFKRPTECNIPSNKRLKSRRERNAGRPDYVVNPKKWTKYEMKDTPILDEAQNKKAALQLFADLKAKKEAANDPSEAVDIENTKIVFKKPSGYRESGTKSSDYAVGEGVYDFEDECNKEGMDVFGGTKKLVMDEHVVGEKKKKKKSKGSKIASISSNPKNEVKLSYLSFEDGE